MARGLGARWSRWTLRALRSGWTHRACGAAFARHAKGAAELRDVSELIDAKIARVTGGIFCVDGILHRIEGLIPPGGGALIFNGLRPRLLSYRSMSLNGNSSSVR